MQLSSRLQCIADFVRPGDRVIDVGTDHAYIPIWLLQQKMADSVIATDIRTGPLARARQDAERCGLSEKLRFFQSDGLTGCPQDAVDTIIIAGMGGETISHILSDAPWAKEKRIILQPQTKQAELRQWLSENGYAIRDASLVYDTGRIYLVWLAEAGMMPRFRGVDDPLLIKRDPLLKPYLEEQIKRLRKRLHGVLQAKQQNEVLSAAMYSELSQLEDIYDEVNKWQT